MEEEVIYLYLWIICKYLLIVVSVLGGLFILTILSPRFQGCLVYLHWINPIPAWIFPMHILKPKNSDQFFLQSKEGNLIGAWLVRPDEPRQPKQQQEQEEEKEKARKIATSSSSSSSSSPLYILYFHGNAASRRHFRRKRSYQRLLHIFQAEALLTIDYRGFGDSPGTPTEEGLISDALTAYDYLTTSLNVPGDRIIVWGHSLGSGVATGLVAHLCQSPAIRQSDDVTLSMNSTSSSFSSSTKDISSSSTKDISSSSSSSSSSLSWFPSSPSTLVFPSLLTKERPAPKALFLEAPFRSVRLAATGHCVGRPLFLLPPRWRQFILDRLVHRFESERRIQQGLCCPLMILHSEDDLVINVQHSRVLTERARESGIKTTTAFLNNLGHNGISLSPQIDPLIHQFLASL